MLKGCYTRPHQPITMMKPLPNCLFEHNPDSFLFSEPDLLLFLIPLAHNQRDLAVCAREGSKCSS